MSFNPRTSPHLTSRHLTSRHVTSPQHIILPHPATPKANTQNAFQTYVVLSDKGDKFGPNPQDVATVGQDSCRHIITIKINPVNDAPMFSLTQTDISLGFSTTEVRIPGFLFNRSNGGADEAGHTPSPPPTSHRHRSTPTASKTFPSSTPGPATLSSRRRTQWSAHS